MRRDIWRALAHLWRTLRCGLGFHGSPVGLIDWLAPYKPGSDALHYRHFVGCPHCRMEITK